MIIPSGRQRLVWAVASATAIAGTAATLHYHRLDLTLSHYDARGHLVVARRIIDSISPGWQQVGAVWLPLPHLLNALPAQVDLFYQTGASAVAISVASFAVAAAAIAWIALSITESYSAAATAAVAFALNPNVLYLQATPMTEPLLLALLLGAVALLMRWCDGAVERDDGSEGGETRSEPEARDRTGRLAGVALALACLTRYEAWPVTVCTLAIAVWVLWRLGSPFLVSCRRVGVVAVAPALAVVGFVVFSRVVIGAWFTAGGFFVPENEALGKPLAALAEIGWGVRALSSWPATTLGAVGLAGLAATSFAVPRRGRGLLVLALLAAVALPWVAFLEGHPFRIRYMVPLLPAQAVGIGAAVGMVKRAPFAAAIVTLSVLAHSIRPLDSAAPMVLEAQWDRPNVEVRLRVTDCLRADYDGEKIMASMGSLGHYMQETSREGFRLRDFLHEGNGDIWLAALEGPRPYAGWLLIEEKAEGGDMLARVAKGRPAFLDGYTRTCEGAGVALYRRTAPTHRP